MIVIDNENNIKKRLDVFLVEYFEKYQRSKISSLIEEGYVFVNEKIQKPSYKTKLNDKITFKEDFEAFLNKTKNTYSLVFLDPPYHKDFIQKALFIMVKNNLLDKDAIIVMESDFDEEYIIPDEIKVIKEKCYGRIKIRIGVRLWCEQ